MSSIPEKKCKCIEILALVIPLLTRSVMTQYETPLLIKNWVKDVRGDLFLKFWSNF